MENVSAFLRRATGVALLAGLTAVPAMADNTGELGEMAIRRVTYEMDGTTFESTIVWDVDEKGARPGVLMVPNWMGPTRASLEKAIEVADRGYVVMMADLYGVDVRPQNTEEAAEAAGFLRGDRELMRERAARALEVLTSQESLPLNTGELAAIGFCFGGGAVLEFARTGVDLDAVVSFHGDLLSPTLDEDSGNIEASVLVLHGADDPFVPQENVQQWISVMMETEVDWQLVQFSNTVHSFTDPDAAMEGKAEYNPLSAERAFAYMGELFEEKFED